jgi:tetratricopeptide (TPR) repeat protein
VKLLDFGTSRFLDEQTPTTLAVAMTPKYASPEQLRGERLTTASDVFSLGLILYELLIGAPAFPSGSSLMSVMARAVEDTNAADPGLAITEAAAAARGCSVSQLREAVCGDLASVAHKALAHEPEQRYPSVGEFAADLERYREGQPILARPQTWKYRAAKFLRRNRISAIAGVIVAIALIASVWVSLYQARVAAQQRRIAEVRLESLRKLTSTVLFEFHDAIQQLPGATQARKLLAQRALEYLNSVDPSTAREPAQRAQLIEAYREIGDVQGNPTNANLGDTAGALASYNKALALAEPMEVSNPNDLNARRNLALLLQKIADTQAVAGDVPGAVERSKRSLAMFIDLASRDEQVGAQQQAGTAHIKLADLLGHPSFANLGDRRGALEHYQQAEQIYVSLSHPADAVTRRYLGIIDERIGRMLELDGRTAEALARYEQSFAIREALATDYPTNTNARRDVAIAHEKIGDLLLASGQIGGAFSRFRKALDIFESLHALDPLNANATRAVAIEYEKLATTYERAGDRASASPLYSKALNIYRGMSAADPSNMRVRSDVDRLVKYALRRADLSSSQH